MYLLQAGKDQSGNEEPPDSPLNRTLPVWGVFLGNDQNRDLVLNRPSKKTGKPPTSLEEINRIMRLMPEQAE